jgi:hypothetical protein
MITFKKITSKHYWACKLINTGLSLIPEKHRTPTGMINMIETKHIKGFVTCPSEEEWVIMEEGMMGDKNTSGEFNG